MGKSTNPLVAALLYDGLCAFEFACAAEVFGLPRPELGDAWYRFETCASHRRVRGQYGATMSADAGLAHLESADIVIIPGWRGIDELPSRKTLDAIRGAHARGARLASICSGAFVLAAAGLLDGKRATTHWRYADALQTRYPLIQVDSDVIYVDEGQVLTSAGSAAGLDLCLHLVRSDYGPKIANHVARRLVISPHRDGAQAQFVERPVQKHTRSGFSRVLESMRQRLREPQSLANLASSASMSERTFLRRFKSSTGTTPAEWLSLARVDLARELLERSRSSIEEIAAQTGLGTPATLRHHFRKKLGTSPSAYRQRFQR